MKLVIYQDQKSYWVVATERWNEFLYESELKPIRFAIAQCSDIWAEQLVELFENNKEMFIEIIKAELDECFNFYQS